MKTITNLLSIGLALFLSSQLLPAQLATTSTAKDSLDRAADLSVMLEALATVEPVAFDSQPKNRRGQVMSVGFVSMQHPEWPPLPCNFYGLDVWPLGEGHFVLDDRKVDYAALALEASLEEAVSLNYAPQMRMMSSSLTSYAYGNPVYLTNLVVTSASGLSAAFDLAGGTNNVPYDIQMTTNLLSPWNWLGIGYTSNRYTFTSQPTDAAFYRLAKPSRTMTVGWGFNYFNQCDPPAGLTNAHMIVGGAGYTVALLNNGTAVGWGGRANDSSIPTNQTGIAMIASGFDHKVALLTNGTVLVWDSNPIFGQNAVPANLTNVAVISAQYLHTLALRKDGTVLSWGDPNNPALTNVPASLTNAVAIAAGGTHNLAVKADGTVVAWGDNGSGQCTMPSGLSNVLDVAAGWAHSVALKRNGTIVVWGNNTLGELNVPAGLSNVVQIAAAGYPGYSSFTMALKLDGTVVTWGKNLATLPLNGLNNVIAIGAEYDSGFAIRTGPPTPVVTLEPVDQFQTAGGSVSFSVKAQALYAVTYQWQTNGVNLTGATNTTLTLTNVQLASPGSYRAVITDNGGYGSLASSNANLTVITPPVFIYQSTPTNQVTIYGKRINYSGVATALGMTNGFPMSYSWQFNGTNLSGVTANAYGFNLNDNNPGIYTLIASNAAGSASVSWQVSQTNFIDVTQDLLLIYNTNSADSTTCLNYYLAHRPNVSGANVLGLGYTNPVAPGYYEAITPANLTAKILNPVAAWLTNNPTKRPQYVILFMDLPGRVCVNTAKPVSPAGYGAVPASSSVCVKFRDISSDWQPYVTHLNMGMTNAVNRTNDCIAYINKLASLGVPISSNSPVLSANLGGYSNTNYIFDNVRFGIVCTNSCENYSNAPSISEATNALLGAGVSPAAIRFYDGVVITNDLILGTGYTTTIVNGQTYTVTNNALKFHATNGNNVAGYVSWGTHGVIAANQTVDGEISWTGNSGWYLMQTMESYNGQQIWLPGAQGTFTYWFCSSAFGGTNYSNTPVGAVSTVEEPNISGKNDNSIYFGLWASGKNFGVCAWESSRYFYFQATGDPLLTH